MAESKKSKNEKREYFTLSDMLIDGIMFEDKWFGMSQNYYQTPFKITLKETEKIVRATYGKVMFEK